MTQTSLSRTLRSGSFVAIGLVLQGVATYAYNVIASSWLGPTPYGALASWLNLLLVLTVLSMGLGTTASRRIAADPRHRDVVARQITATSLKAAAVLSLSCVLAAPLLSAWLHLDSWWPGVLLALAVFPLTLAGGWGGILQGEEKWLPFGLLYLSIGLGRITLGVAALALWPTMIGAMIGVALGAFAPALLGWGALRRTSITPDFTSRLGRESLANAHALGAFFTLTSLDILVARATFEAEPAGWYAGGVLLSKAVLFAPQFVMVVAFPTMARDGNSRMYLQALRLLALVGVLAVGAVIVMRDLALLFVGGDAYSPITDALPYFAALGGVLAMVQLLVYQVLARQHGGSGIVVLWAGCVAAAASALVVQTPTALVWWVLAVDSLVLLVLVTLVVRRSHADDPADG